MPKEMTPVTKWTALQLRKKNVDDEVFVDLHIGKDEGYRSIINPTLLHDTEPEAVKYAYDQNKYGTWLISPVIEFDNY